MGQLREPLEAVLESHITSPMLSKSPSIGRNKAMPARSLVDEYAAFVLTINSGHHQSVRHIDIVFVHCWVLRRSCKLLL